MAKESGIRLCWVLGILLVILLGVVMIMGPLVRLRVVLKTDPQGHARIAGIPLRNPQLRDAVLRTLHVLGCETRLWTGVPITNSTQTSNLSDTLAAIERYNPPLTNINTGPSPYE